MKKYWQLLQPDNNLVENIRGELQCNPVTATILVNRKIISKDDALRFLKPSLNNMRPPCSMKDMDAAVRRIYSAITGHEKILIFGDYDVDGITATTILFEFLHYTKADVSYYIPHRTKEGYGLHTKHITDYAIPNKINLIITVDCGSSSDNAVKTASGSGIDVIITDHHEISDKPSRAVAVLNPKRHDCSSGFDDLAGVGVAFYLLICLRKQMRDNHFWQNRPEPNLKNLCDLVALGTVADMVPIVDENRILVKTGLEIINAGDRCGIKTLMESSGIIRLRRTVNTEDIAFRLAPRLNAAGRIEHASAAVELLTTNNLETARQLARSLNSMNFKRHDIEQKIMEDISEYLKNNQYLLKNSSLVLSDNEFGNMWHEGVLGIIASRMVKKYFRPVVLIAIKEGVGKGSARSIPGFNIYKGLMLCSDLLEAFGGHSMAAGLTIKAEHMDIFQKNFENTVQQTTSPDDFMQTISIDYELNFEDISDALINELETLKPFGTGNHEPLFMAKNVSVMDSKIVGKNHRRMHLKQSAAGGTGNSFNAIHFNVDTNKNLRESFDQIAFRLHWNYWNGKKTAQIVIEHIL
ncbi:MAG: single-stranded-DNA-specific exonuclease RecJ [Desulfobacteraceae bacterium]|uniref:Single-stranded-DNA-specific exonuclease RecJ n=1 Tax=Candidatus Desulfaltia bathyphila TaxID=2841697 RepID=A0A8J6N7W3_9BACT|nr:single-stranded-DNA-specific exonuclease RecJ [Candidatus Desulfaltia bathyphila]